MQPPEVVEAGDLVLRRWQVQWAEQASAAIVESLPELTVWLSWAKDGHTPAASKEFIERTSGEWDNGTDFNYAIFTSTGELVGGIGLMTRRGPGVLEIGYWLRSSYSGRGYMTAAVKALSDAALALPGIDRVHICHDAANGASGAVAAKAGFVEVERIDRVPETPGDTGIDVVRERL